MYISVFEIVIFYNLVIVNIINLIYLIFFNGGSIKYVHSCTQQYVI